MTNMLEGKVAIVTGAARGLGQMFSCKLARAGAVVVAADRNNCEETVAEIKKNGDRGTSYQADVTDHKSLKDMADKVTRDYGRIDILVNNAALYANLTSAPFDNLTEEEWDEIMAVQIKGTLFGCQVFGRQMLEQGCGSIINISSASAGPPLSKAFTYSVAKAGIKNLTQNIAREWATQGVRVNAIRPGFFPTEWSIKNFITPEREQAILGHTAMARYGKPEELLGAVLWLASDAASFVTGAEIAVDGGFSAMTI